MWEIITDLFHRYMGTGLIFTWFIVMLCYLLLREERKYLRVLFVYIPLAILALFFNPWLGEIFYRYVAEDIYYRILWLLPVTVVIAYGIVHVYGTLDGNKKRWFVPVCLLLILVSGKYIYSDVHFHKAENLYHVPQSVADICDYIEVEGREVMAAFPQELMLFVRQYSPTVCMPYGRETQLDQWGNHNPFYEAMNAPVLDIPELVRMARENGCHYLIVPKEKSKEGDFQVYNFQLLTTIRGYEVYGDTENVPALIKVMQRFCESSGDQLAAGYV
jgi:hypothetical protein